MKFIRVIPGTGERIEQEVLECYLGDGLGLVDVDSLTYIVLGGGPEYRPVSFGPVTMSGLLLTMASNSGGAGFRLPVGTAPQSPVTGDLWPTVSGLFFRRSGVTVQLGEALTWSGVAAVLPATFNAGNPGGSWAPNYANGPTQRAAPSGALTITAPTNMTDGKTLNFRVAVGGFDVTFATADYEGDQLTFALASGVLRGSILHYGVAKYTVVAAVY